jgi:hypothetical protein
MDNTKTNIKCIYPVWISMTTTPDRMDKTYKVIVNTLAHLSGLDKLVLNIPTEYKRFPSNPQGVNAFRTIRDPRFILNITRDYGPATKLIPVLDIIPWEAILIICDDECYNHDAFKIAAEAQEKQRSKSFTFWKYMYKELVVPQGVDIITFWRPNLSHFAEYANNALRTDSCFFVDDMVIGGFLSQTGVQIEQLQRKWKWPWRHNCFDGPKESLYSKKGEFSRDNANASCYKQIYS